MDPITSLGLAGNVVQLAEFAAKLVSEGNRIYKSADGTLVEERETTAVIHDLQKLSKSLVDSLHVWSSSTSGITHDNDTQLEEICKGCQAISNELLARLQKLVAKGGQHNRLRSYKQALISVWKKEEVERVAQRLKKYQDELNTRILHRLITDAQSWKATNRTQYDTLSKQGQDAISIILRSSDHLATLLQMQSQQLQDIAASHRRVTEALPSELRRKDLKVVEPSMALHDAVQLNKLSLVKRLLRQPGIDVNEPNDQGQTALHLCTSYTIAAEMLKSRLIDANAIDDHGRTALHHSALKRRPGVMRALLGAGADKPVRDDQGKTARDYAFNCPVAKLMLDHGSDPNGRVSDQNPLFLYMAYIGDEEGLRFLLDAGANIDVQDPVTRTTALCIVARRGELDLVKLLCERGADLELPGTNDWPVSPLMSTVSYGRVEVMKYLLGRDARTEVRLQSGNNVLAQCFYRKKWDCVRLLLQQGEDVDTRNHEGQTPLTKAALEGEVAMVELLLSMGAQQEVRDNRGLTPLEAAAEGRRTQCLRILLQAHADVTTRDHDGWTSLAQVARHATDLECVQLLLDHHAPVNARGHAGNTALNETAWHGRPESAKLLLDHGADATIRSNDKQSPLSIAAGLGHVEVMRVLLDGGVDPNEKATDQSKFEIAVMRAAQEGKAEAIRLLAKYGADMDVKDAEGRTPLMHAVWHSHNDVVAALIEAGAALDVQDTLDRGGDTALSIATDTGNEACVQILPTAGAKLQLRNRCGWTAWSKAVFAGHDQRLARFLKPTGTEGEVLRTKQEQESPEEIARYMIEHCDV